MSDKSFLGRKFKWGICDIEDRENSDFVLLHRLLLFYFADSTIELTETFADDYIHQNNGQSKLTMGFMTGLTLAAVFGLALKLNK